MALQPGDQKEYRELIGDPFGSMHLTDIGGAVAYATLGGARSIHEACSRAPADRWRSVQKRWLIGIDWFRSEPAALDFLSSLPSSLVRVHKGRDTLRRSGCTPGRAYHPKLFVLRAQGIVGVVSGSGNLSSSGQQRGVEAGSSLIIKAPISRAERPILRELKSVVRWFEQQWDAGDDWGGLREDYTREYYENAKREPPTPTEDDAADTELTLNARGRRSLSGERLRRLRGCCNLWVEAGNLHENRGAGKAGNQLMLSAMTRVFFGFPATDVPRDTLLGHVTIRYGSNVKDDYSMRFSNNSMDVLSLPIPGAEGPPRYDQQLLRFERISQGLATIFNLVVGPQAEGKRWQSRSQAIGGAFQMTSGRRWGVF